MEEHPFLLRKTLLCGAYDDSIENGLTSGLLTDASLERLNFMAREAFEGRKVDYALLARAALFLHRRYAFYLENFEIEQDYYLNLAHQFAQMGEGEEGDYLEYLIERERGNLKKALKLADSLVRKYGRNYLVEKARILLEMGDRDAAYMIYEELLENPRVWIHLGDALIDMGECEDAVKIYEKFLEHEPDDWEALYHIAQCLVRLKREREAIEYLKGALESNKYHLESYLLLARIYRELGMENERRKMLGRMKRLGFPGEVVP